MLISDKPELVQKCDNLFLTLSTVTVVAMEKGAGGAGLSIEMPPVIKFDDNKAYCSSVSISFSIFAYNGTRAQQ